MNEIALENLKFSVDYTPSEIKINNQEVLENLVVQVENKYKGLIITDESEVPKAKTTRAEVKKIAKVIDDKRKEIKKEFNTPLQRFESEIKGYTERLNNLVVPIDESIKQYEETQRMARLEEVKKDIAELAPNYNLEIEEIEIQASWLNKTTSQKKRLKEMKDIAEMLNKRKEQRKQDITVISSYCEALQVENGGWLTQLGNGLSAPEIMAQIDKYIQDKKEQEEKRSLAEKQRAEYEAEMTRLKEEQAKSVVEKAEEIEKVNVPQTPQLETVTLKFTGTIEQLTRLSEFIESEGIQVEKA